MAETEGDPTVTYQEFLIVASIGAALSFLGLVALYYSIVLEDAGMLRLTASVATIAVGVYAIHAGWVGKSWVGKIKPDSAAERQRKIREKGRRQRRNQ